MLHPNVHIFLFRALYSLAVIYGAGLVFVILRFKGVPVDRWLNNFLNTTSETYKRAATVNPVDNFNFALQTCQTCTVNPSARKFEIESSKQLIELEEATSAKKGLLSN